MDYELSSEFRSKYKKQNVRLQKAIDKTLELFTENPQNSELDNHPLKRDLIGFRSVHIIKYRTNDYCAVYKEFREKDGSLYAYFTTFGTHKELFY
jgi:mRNA-degrading endonuclease YafQ of YafQ-DinJ toxin-antitoxin module